MEDRNSLSRLTEREKVCLRQWLQHKSAKEIATELGISHHAVEKRLKMARTKLRVTSSLEAARMLCEAEGYGQVVHQSPDLVSDALRPHSGVTRTKVMGVAIMFLVGATVLGLLLHPAAVSQVPSNQTVGAPRQHVGTEAALRKLIAGMQSGSPDYNMFSPEFGEMVRQQRPMSARVFSGLGELKSISFSGLGPEGDDLYKVVFAHGTMMMSVLLDPDGKMTGGIIRPEGAPAPPAFTPGGVPTPGTEAALRKLVAGIQKDSPDYDKLSPQFAEIVRRDLPFTHRLFSGLGELKSMTFRGRGQMGDDTYELVFANGSMIMSAVLDANGRMAGGIFHSADSRAR